MAKWYDQWLTENERKHLQVGQKGIRARRRQQEDAENRGYPKSSIPISQYQNKNAVLARAERMNTPKPAAQKTGGDTKMRLTNAFKKKAR